MARMFVAATPPRWRQNHDIVSPGVTGQPVAVLINTTMNALAFSKAAAGSEQAISIELASPKGSGGVSGDSLFLVVFAYGDGSAAGTAKMEVTTKVNGVAVPLVANTVAVPADTTTMVAMVIEALTNAQYSELQHLNMVIQRADNADGADTYVGALRVVSFQLYTQIIS